MERRLRHFFDDDSTNEFRHVLDRMPCSDQHDRRKLSHNPPPTSAWRGHALRVIRGCSTWLEETYRPAECSCRAAPCPPTFSETDSPFLPAMPDRLLSVDVDPELLPGAHNAIHTCLRLQPTNASRSSPTRPARKSPPPWSARSSPTARRTAFSCWKTTLPAR